MIAQTLAGLFAKPAQAQAALEELHRAGFLSARLSESAPAKNAPAPEHLQQPQVEFFMDHASTGSEFRRDLTALGIAEEDAGYFEYGIARGGALVTVPVSARVGEAMNILARYGADMGHQTLPARAEVEPPPSPEPSGESPSVREKRLLASGTRRMI